MNIIKRSLSIVMTVCTLICWWGYFFPELTLTPDTVRMVDSSGELVSEMMSSTNRSMPHNQSDDSTLYRQLLMAKPEEIRIRSGLFEALSSYWEAFQNGIN